MNKLTEITVFLTLPPLSTRSADAAAVGGSDRRSSTRCRRQTVAGGSGGASFDRSARGRTGDSKLDGAWGGRGAAERVKQVVRATRRRGLSAPRRTDPPSTGPEHARWAPPPPLSPPARAPSTTGLWWTSSHGRLKGSPELGEAHSGAGARPGCVERRRGLRWSSPTTKSGGRGAGLGRRQ
jgi:hypothetical protein